MSERHILLPRWGGIESGATLSDDFRTMWDIIEVGSKERHLIHRCYVDSDNPKDHGCSSHAYTYASGCEGFINMFLAGELEGDYSEVEFLENLGMFLGVVSHHVADLCTPVHVGHKLNLKRMGVRTFASLHRKFERKMGRIAKDSLIRLCPPKTIELNEKYFYSIAQETYHNLFLKLEDVITEGNDEEFRNIVTKSLSYAIQHTVDVWYTILDNSGMAKRKWSMQPLF